MVRVYIRVFIATKNLENLDKSRHIADFFHSSLDVDIQELRRKGKFSEKNQISIKAKERSGLCPWLLGGDL